MDENKEELPKDYTQVINISAVTNEEMRRRRAGNVPEEKEEVKEVEEKKEEKPQETKQPKKNKSGKKINVRLVCFIVILVCVIIITVCLVFLKIRNLNSKYKYEEPVQTVFETENKEVDTSLQYVFKEGDTYNVNGIVITDYYYQNGRDYLVSDNPTLDYNQFYTSYSLISGLKNKDIENKINTIIKQKCMDTNWDHTYTTMSVGMGNIFSVEIAGTAHDDNKYYGKVLYATTFDLNTGNELTIDDVFTKSTPVVSIFTDAYLRYNAWGEENLVPETNMGAFHGDMSRVDTSEYEDAMFKVKKMYEANKNNLKFTITPGSIRVYGIEGGNDYSFQIPMYKNLEYVICYNKFKTADLYENSFALTGVPLYAWPSPEYAKGEKKQLIYFESNKDYYINFYRDPDQYRYQGDINSGIVNAKIMDIINNIKNNYSGNGIININGSVNLQNPGLSNGSYLNIGEIPHYEVQLSYNVGIKKGNKTLNYYLAEANSTPWSYLSPRCLNDIKSYHLPDEDEIETVLNSDTRFGDRHYITWYFDANWNYLGDNKDCVKVPLEYYNPDDEMHWS